MLIATRPNIDLNGRYSVSQASKVLGIHRNTVTKLSDTGTLKCRYRKGTMRKFFLGSELMKYWSSQI